MTATTTRRWVPWLAVAVIVLGVANFLAFLIASAALGGDALNGHVTDGHYFVACKCPAEFIEVSQAAWTTSRIHAIVTLLSWPLTILSMAFLLFRYVFPFMTSGNAPGQASARVAALRSSGPLLWQGWPGGVEGTLTWTAGMLGAEIYSDGIVVTQRFMPANAIRAEEIRSVRLGRRLMTATIEVEHAGIDVTSPLILYGGADSPQARALLSLGSVDAAVVTPPAAPNGIASGAPAAAPVETRRAVPGPMRAMSLLGLAVAVVMIIAGVFFVIPSLGTFGIVWTGMAVLILVINGRRFITRGW
jgi:hypothetical protein